MLVIPLHLFYNFVHGCFELGVLDPNSRLLQRVQVTILNQFENVLGLVVVFDEVSTLYTFFLVLKLVLGLDN